MTHVSSLENTIITLSDTEDTTPEHKRAKKLAVTIKRKRQHRKSQEGVDSDASKE